MVAQVAFGAVSLNGLTNRTPVVVEEVSLAQLSENQLYIATPFAKPVILNPEQKQQLQERVVLKVELVYTRFRSSPTFNQQLLNLNRLKELNRLVPGLFEAPLWEFQLTEQTKGNNPEVCNQMFHGFIITFRPNSSNSMLKQEADYLKKLVGSFLKQDSIDRYNNPTTTNSNLTGSSDSTGTGDSTSSGTTKKPMKFTIKTHYDKKWGYIYDTIWFVDTVKPPPPPDFFYNHQLYQDSTVLNAFDRNRDWSNFIVVTDVTGSMSPYSAQVFIWLKAQTQNDKAKYFVFFNDGDDTESRKKKPLETKGIYVTENKGVDAVMQTATKCMLKGSGGGESLENDVEALIEGAKYYTSASSLILIADNFESMRDYDFINKVSKPVHVILCGSERGVNIQYLDLAYRTKGTVHTKFSDVTNLNDLKEGEHIYIDEQKYLFKNKRFHFVYDAFQYQNSSVR
ncbi:MAG: hypothetical protein KDD41_00865 [Flavobacteriales bacterium]|nr:hypothetical protein [Flavobacteriales bacterium]